ncbi:MAG: hypothetical protein RIQ81_173 [Pseudomonadota bacterium]|jgi:hypothetical protein
MKSKKLSKTELKRDENTKLRKGGEWTRRVNVDIPVWAITELDREASRRGITRQSLIKTWLIDRIDAIQTTGGSRAG